MKEHIIINKDRTVVVPDSVRKIGIQYDHKVNTLTFDCPRYADDNQSIDLSRMAIYINFSRNDKTKGSVAATNIFVDPDNPEIMHFDVDITRSVTLVNGPIICLVCAKSTDAEGVEVNHWNSELFNKLSVGEGLEAEELTEEEIDYITSLLQEINTTRAEVADMDTRVEDLEFNQEKQGAVSEVDLETMTWTEGSYITGSGTIGSSSGYGISELVTLPKMSTLILDATGYQSDIAMIAKSDHTPLVTSVYGKTHYEYYTDEEIQVYISCKTTVAKSAKIVRNVAETLSDLERENSELKGDLSQLSEEIINQAEVDDDGLVSFKNSQGLTLFTLDLSEFSGGGNVYGELVISTESLSINEGESGTFTVKLATAPTINQVVYLAVSDNTKLSVSPSNLTFSPENWGTEQIITVTAEQDDDATDETITVSLTSKKVSGKAVSVLIADDEVENPFIDNMVSLIYSTDVDKENYTYYDTATGENVSWINSGSNTEISAFKNIFSVTSMKVTEAYNRVVESGEFTIILVTDETDETDAWALSQNLKNCQYSCCRIYNKFSGTTWDNIYTECSMTYINSNGEQSTLSENANTSTVINNLAIKSENWLYAISAITLKKNGEIDWYAGPELIHTTPAPEDFVKWDMSTVTSSWANWRVTVYAAVDHWLILDKAVSGADIRSYYEYLASKASVTSF